MWAVADFETTTSAISEEESRVWLWCVVNENAIPIGKGKDIESFMIFVKKNLLNYNIYFHNLAFDGVFILAYLFNNNFNYKEKVNKSSDKSFSTLIGSMGQYYQIKVNFARYKQVIFLDSLKLLPDKVSKIAKDFNLIEQKLEINYDKVEYNKDTEEYIYHDCIIVAKALKICFDMGCDKMTIGSASYHKMQEFQPLFKRLFEVDIDDDLLANFRLAYRGGRSQVNPLYKGKILHNVKRYDVNSMYPSIMYNCQLPYGRPIKVNERGKYKFEIYHIIITFSLKENHIPSLLKNGGLYRDSKYYIDSEIDEELWITSIDYLLLERNYNIYKVTFLDIYGFWTTDIAFKDFISYYYNIKLGDNKGMKAVSKKVINNAYGKFGTKLQDFSKIPYIEDGIIKYNKGEMEERGRYHLGVAMGVTSYGHLILDNEIQYVGYENFVYCDTDSIHTFKELAKEKVHDTYLGKFKLEAIEEVCKYVRQKCYITKENGNWHITCSGLPDRCKESLIEHYKDDILYKFDIGLKIAKDNKDGIACKLIHKNVKGGVLLLPTDFEIKEG